jgi:hypothetical protein
MGGAWLALAWLIDRRESNGRRVLKVIAVTIVLFVPDSFKPEVSYLSHFLGYFAGVFSGVLYYFIFKKKILSEEVLEVIPDEEEYYYEDYDQEYFDVEKAPATDHLTIDSQYYQKEQ